MNQPASTPKMSHGAVWMILARFSERALGVVSISILARLLSPAQFGVVALAGSVVALIEVFSSFGFDWALVRLPHPTREHYDTAWTLRMALGVATFIVLGLLAVPAAAFYRRPELIPVIIAMGCCSMIGAAENIGTVEYRRNVRFDIEFWMRFLSKLAAIVVATLTAYLLRSYWALVCGVAANRIASTVLSYRLHTFRPRLRLSGRQDLLSFSLWLLLANLIDFTRLRLASVVLGRTFDTHTVGVYSMATELANLTSTELAAPINRVAFSSYAQIASDVAELRRRFLDVSSIIWAVGLPAAIGIGLCSSGIVRLLLGPQWLGAAPIVSILAIGAALDVMVANTHTVYWTTGGSQLVTKLSATGMAIFVPALVILTRAYGLTGAAVAYTLTAAALLPLNYRFLMRTLSLGLGQIAARNWRVVAACALMAAATYPVSRQVDINTAATALAQLMRAVPVGVATYVVALQLIWMLAGRPPGPEVAINGAVRRTLSALIPGAASRF